MAEWRTARPAALSLQLDMDTRAAITPVGVAVDVRPNAARTFFEGAVFITHLRVTIFLPGGWNTPAETRHL